MIDFLNYYEILKKYVPSGTSDETLMNDVLSVLIDAVNITNKNGDPLYLDKTRVSRLLSRKDEIPNSIRSALSIKNIAQKTKQNMSYFLDHSFSKDDLICFTDEIKELIIKNNDIACNTKKEVCDRTDDIVLFHIEVLLYLLSINIRKDEQSILWKKGKNRIDYIVGDIFKYSSENRKKEKNIIVIPVDTSFETRLSEISEGVHKPLISINSLHGQFIKRLSLKGISSETLKYRINDDLRCRDVKPIKCSDTNENRQNYNIGEMAVIEEENAIYFLLAISELDENNNSQSSHQNIETAIKTLLKRYDQIGQGIHLYIPLIGTGLSRANLSTQESFDLIKRCLIENSNIVHGHISIVIYHKDFEDLSIDSR